MKQTQSLYPHKTTAALRSSLVLFSLISNPIIVRLALLFWKLLRFFRIPINPLVRYAGYDQFCAGENVASCGPTLDRMLLHGVSSVLDYAHEHAQTEKDFAHNTAVILKTICAAELEKKQHFAVVKPSAIGLFSLFEDKSVNKPLTLAKQRAWESISDRFQTLTQAAQANGIVLMVDAEESWIQPAVNELLIPLLRKYNKKRVVLAVTIQLYLKDNDLHYKELLADAATHQYRLGVKLVRGAYLEKERERAHSLAIEAPVCATKAQTDSQFRKALEMGLEACHTHLCIVATHNEADVACCLTYCQENQIPVTQANLWFSQLYGMRDFISFSLAAKGANVFKYVPFGPVAQAVPYLIRRALENSSMKAQTARERSMIKEELRRRRANA